MTNSNVKNFFRDRKLSKSFNSATSFIINETPPSDYDILENRIEYLDTILLDLSLDLATLQNDNTVPDILLEDIENNIEILEAKRDVYTRYIYELDMCNLDINKGRFYD